MAVIRVYEPADEAQVLELWASSGLTVPWNDPLKDLARKLAEEPGEMLVAADSERVNGTAMAGYDGHRGWIYDLAVAGDRSRDGIGRQLVTACEDLLAARGCPKVNFMVRGTDAHALEFYARVGYAPSDVVTLGKRLERDA